MFKINLKSALIVATLVFSLTFSNLIYKQNLTASATSLPILNTFQHGFSNDIYPDYRNATFGGPENATILSGPWMQTKWDQYGDEHTSWLTKFNDPTNSTKIPYFYAYIAAGKAKDAYGLKDCNVGNPSLCEQGADFIRNNSATVLQAYTDFGNKIKSIYGTTRPIIIHPDPDFFQYTESKQQGGGPLTQEQMKDYMNQWTAALKTALPNATLVMDVSPWNPNLANFVNGLENFDYAGLVGKRYSPNTTAVDNYTYSQISQITGKKLIINDAHGVNGAMMNYDTNWTDRQKVQTMWDDGVVAVLMPPNNNTNLAQTINGFKVNPVPSGASVPTSSAVISSANSSIQTSSLVISSTTNSTANSAISQNSSCTNVVATRQQGGADWYNMELKLINNGASLSNGEISFELPNNQTVQSGWNNTYTQIGRAVTVKTTQTIATGQTGDFGGLTINNANPNTLPTIFAVSPNLCPSSSTISSQTISLVNSNNSSAQNLITSSVNSSENFVSSQTSNFVVSSLNSSSQLTISNLTCNEGFTPVQDLAYVNNTKCVCEAPKQQVILDPQTSVCALTAYSSVSANSIPNSSAFSSTTPIASALTSNFANSSVTSQDTVSPIPYSLGSVKNSIVGTVGKRDMSPIILIGNTYPAGTLAVFTPAGSNTSINGQIIYIPSPISQEVISAFGAFDGQIIPTDSLTGEQIGILRAGVSALSIPTNFANPVMSSQLSYASQISSYVCLQPVSVSCVSSSFSNSQNISQVISSTQLITCTGSQKVNPKNNQCGTFVHTMGDFNVVGNCTIPTDITIGDSYNCAFPLTGGSNYFTDYNITTYTKQLNAQSSEYGDLCYVQGNTLVCNNIPTNAQSLREGKAQIGFAFLNTTDYAPIFRDSVTLRANSNISVSSTMTTNPIEITTSQILADAVKDRINCGNSYVLAFVPTTCTFSIPQNYTYRLPGSNPYEYKQTFTFLSTDKNIVRCETPNNINFICRDLDFGTENNPAMKLKIADGSSYTAPNLGEFVDTTNAYRVIATLESGTIGTNPTSATVSSQSLANSSTRSQPIVCGINCTNYPPISESSATNLSQSSANNSVATSNVSTSEQICTEQNMNPCIRNNQNSVGQNSSSFVSSTLSSSLMTSSKISSQNSSSLASSQVVSSFANNSSSTTPITSSKSSTSSQSSSKIPNQISSPITSLKSKTIKMNNKDVTIALKNSDCKEFSSLNNLEGLDKQWVEFRANCAKTEIETIWQGFDTTKKYKLVKYNPTTKTTKKWTANIKTVGNTIVTTHTIFDGKDGDWSSAKTEIWDPYTLEEESTNPILDIITPRSGGETIYLPLAIMCLIGAIYISTKISTKKI